MITPKEYQALIAGGCPHCGEALEIRRGKYGEFVACAEWCGYKKSIVGRSSYPPKKAPQKLCPYNKCNGSGLIPLKNKEGKVVPFCWVYCECKEEPEESKQALRPEDFDFACSRSFRRYQSWITDGVDLPDTELNPEPQPASEPEWKPKSWDRFQQLERRVIHVEKKFVELRAKRIERKDII